MGSRDLKQEPPSDPPRLEPASKHCAPAGNPATSAGASLRCSVLLSTVRPKISALGGLQNRRIGCRAADRLHSRRYTCAPILDPVSELEPL